MLKDYFEIMKGVDGGQSKNCLLRVQFFHTAIFVGKNTGGCGAQFFVFAPKRTVNGYKCIKFGVSFKGFRIGKKKSK